MRMRQAAKIERGGIGISCVQGMCVWCHCPGVSPSVDGVPTFRQPSNADEASNGVLFF